MTTLVATDVAQSLSTAMKAGSRIEHEEAESSSFMAELLEGRLSAEAYADLLLRLRRVYAAMEATIREHADEPMVAALHDPALERLATIEDDLRHWAPGRSDDSVDSPAATAYAERLRAAGAWGGLLVAHHYTRYLGDLSGGQVIGRMLERTYGLEDGVGTAFYRFAEIAKPKPYKDGYRASLDGLDLSAEDTARVVDEVKVAFRLNQALFAELGEDLERYRAR